MLEQIINEVIAMLEQDYCPISLQCPSSDYGSEERCDDHVMCPIFREYVDLYCNERTVRYLNEQISKSR